MYSEQNVVEMCEKSCKLVLAFWTRKQSNAVAWRSDVVASCFGPLVDGSTCCHPTTLSALKETKKTQNKYWKINTIYNEVCCPKYKRIAITHTINTLLCKRNEMSQLALLGSKTRRPASADRTARRHVLSMGVGPFAFRYQGKGATPCQYIDTSRKAIDCATTLPLTVLYNETLQQTCPLLSKLSERRQI